LAHHADPIVIASAGKLSPQFWEEFFNARPDGGDEKCANDNAGKNRSKLAQRRIKHDYYLKNAIEIGRWRGSAPSHRCSRTGLKLKT